MFQVLHRQHESLLLLSSLLRPAGVALAAATATADTERSMKTLPGYPPPPTPPPQPSIDLVCQAPPPPLPCPPPQRRAKHNPMAGFEELFLETPRSHNSSRKTVGGVLFPAVLSPKPAIELDLRQFMEVVKGHKPRLEAVLRSIGALLLRGYPVRTVTDFDQAMEAFGYEELLYVSGAAPRTNIVGRLFTANESPARPCPHSPAAAGSLPLSLYPPMKPT